MSKKYRKINDGKGWVDYPSENTAVNAYNLNHMESGIDNNDTRISDLDANKASKLELAELSGQIGELFNEVDYDNETGVLTFVRKNGESPLRLDLPLEMIALDIYYDPTTEMLTLPLEGGGKFEVDLSRLITEFEFLDSDTVYFTISKIEEKAFDETWDSEKIIKLFSGDPITQKTYESITIESELPISEITAKYAKAGESDFVNAETKEMHKDGKMVLVNFPGGGWKWSISLKTEGDIGGGTKKLIGYYKKAGTVTAGVKEGSIQEKHLRPDYLSEIRVEVQNAEESAEFSAEKAIASENFGYMAESFAHGATGRRPGEDEDNAKYYSEQAKNALESLEQSGTVTGVKGNAESAYRTGNVNVTPANIGALPSGGNAVSATKLVTSHSIFGKTFNGTQDVAGKGFFYGSYRSEASARYNNSAMEIRENGLVGNSQSNSGYAPSIGFHWMNKAAGTLVMDSTGKFHLFRQDGVTPANLEATATNAINASVATKATKDGNGNNIVNTYANKSIYGDTVVSCGRKSGYGIGSCSFAFGQDTVASGNLSHARGFDTKADGTCASAEGCETTASGPYSHSEGRGTTASGNDAHSEGLNTVASGYYSHAEGGTTKATTFACHSEGYRTNAENIASHASGKYNKAMVKNGSINYQIGDAFVIGNGTGDSNLSNALRVTYYGDILGTKAYQSSGADYAEFVKPWADRNLEGEDRIGYFVTVKDGFLHKANEGDYIFGITSGNPSVIGNADEDYYWKYVRDEFNRIVMEDVPEMAQQRDEDGNLVFDKETHEPIMVETGNVVKNARMKLADGYDPSLQESYIPRAERREWDYVGMRGIIPVRDDGTCLQDRFCKCGRDGIATLAEERGFDTFYVIERISENIVSVEI